MEKKKHDIITIYPITNKDNEFEFVGVICRDITERKQAEEKFAQSENLFKGLFDQSPISTHIMDTDGNLLKINHACEKLWGITSEECKNYNMLHDEQLTKLEVMPLIEKGFSGESITIPPQEYDLEKTLGKGNKIWIVGHFYPIKNEAGEISNIILMHEDITERKQAEEALLASEEKYRFLAENAKDVIWKTDMTLKTTYISPSVEKLTGYTSDEWMRMSINDLFSEKSFKNYYGNLQE